MNPNPFKLKAVSKARRMVLAGEWSGFVWPHGVTGVPKEIKAKVNFDSKDKLVRGEMSFRSWVKGRGVIKNQITGGFLNETDLEFYYLKKETGVRGDGRLFLKLLPDAKRISGRVVGHSSHTDEQFYSDLLLIKGRKPDLRPYSVMAKPTLFIGHGRRDDWKKLKEFLEKSGYKVVTFESAMRAGLTIVDVIKGMMTETSFAFLVMTGEDRSRSGKLRPRQNVIHELGLCQANFGLTRAIILLEKGVEIDQFSNIHGLVRIEFGRNRITEVFKVVKATLSREFPRK